jgi:hypothetical protein
VAHGPVERDGERLPDLHGFDLEPGALQHVHSPRAGLAVELPAGDAVVVDPGFAVGALGPEESAGLAPGERGDGLGLEVLLEPQVLALGLDLLDEVFVGRAGRWVYLFFRLCFFRFVICVALERLFCCLCV